MRIAALQRTFSAALAASFASFSLAFRRRLYSLRENEEYSAGRATMEPAPQPRTSCPGTCARRAAAVSPLAELLPGELRVFLEVGFIGVRHSQLTICTWREKSANLLCAGRQQPRGALKSLSGPRPPRVRSLRLRSRVPATTSCPEKRSGRPRLSGETAWSSLGRARAPQSPANVGSHAPSARMRGELFEFTVWGAFWPEEVLSPFCASAAAEARV